MTRWALSGLIADRVDVTAERWLVPGWGVEEVGPARLALGVPTCSCPALSQLSGLPSTRAVPVR